MPHHLSYRCLRGRSSSAGDRRENRSCSSVTQTKRTEDVRSEPLYRKDFQQMDRPLRGPGLPAVASRGPRSHAPRYYIINERDSHQKTHPTFWPEGHFRMDALEDLVEMCPRTTRQAVSRAPQQGPSPQLSEEEEGAPRREPVERSLHPQCLTGLQGAAHFYVGDRSESRTLAPEYQGRVHFKSWDHGFEAPLDRPVYGHRKPRSRNFQSAQHPPKLRGKPKVEPSLTESDSMSAASSSDQQNGGDDRCLQVTRSQAKFPRSVRQLGKRKAISRQELIADLSDLICSNV